MCVELGVEGGWGRELERDYEETVEKFLSAVEESFKETTQKQEGALQEFTRDLEEYQV